MNSLLNQHDIPENGFIHSTYFFLPFFLFQSILSCYSKLFCNKTNNNDFETNSEFVPVGFFMSPN